MSETSCMYHGQDMTWPVCIQLREITHIIMDRFDVSFTKAVSLFYPSKTCKLVLDVENGLWAESAPYIADRFFDEYEANKEAFEQKLTADH